MGKYYGRQDFKSYREKYKYLKENGYCRELIEAEQAGDMLDFVLKFGLILSSLCFVIGLIACIIKGFILFF